SFYLIIWVVIYIEHYELLPMAFGVLGASHFLPYLWIYKSKTYVTFTILMVARSFVFGYIFFGYAFSIFLFLLPIIFFFFVFFFWFDFFLSVIFYSLLLISNNLSPIRNWIKVRN